jgi:hypothetical protein
MEDGSIEFPPLTKPESDLRCDVQATVSPSPTFAKILDNEWYVRVKTEFHGTALSQVKRKIVAEAGERVVELHQGWYFQPCNGSTLTNARSKE